MPESPLNLKSDIIAVQLLSDGDELADLSITSIEIIHRVNMIPFATVVLRDGDLGWDGDLSWDAFELSSSYKLVPGTDIQIKAGYGDQLDTIFQGVLVKHGVGMKKAGGTMLKIECQDPAIRMTLARRNAVYKDLRDSEVAAKLINKHSGLSADVSATKQRHAEMVQYYSSDWEYLLTRAQVNGQIVTVEAGKITVAPPIVNESPNLQVTLGRDIISFDAEIDARTQFSSIDAAAWDHNTQRLLKAEAQIPERRNAQGNLSSENLAQVVGPETLELQSSATIDQTQLENWATSAQVWAQLARIRGHITFPGSAKAKPGTLIRMKGVGSRFEGDAWISSVRHTIEPGEWATEVELGLAPENIAQTHDVAPLPAGGRLPAISGMHIGIVRKLNDDPDKASRVQVEVPVLLGVDSYVWARLTQFQASSTSSGAFHLPEIGDEVVLGFVDDDPSQPIILGSLYSVKHPPPYEMTKENNIKALVGRSQIKVELDDDRKQVMIETPTGNRITLDEKEKLICVEDQHGNTMTLKETGIAVSSPKDISIEAKGSISLSAGGNISMAAEGNIREQATHINHSAKAEFSATGKPSS